MSSEKQRLNNILKTYLENVLRKTTKNDSIEMEAKFGTRKIKKISKIDYDNVVKILKSSGFVLKNSNYLLRIISEYTDIKTGKIQLSTIRTEINGLQDTSIYCKANNLEGIKERVNFVKKRPYGINNTNTNTNDKIPTANFDDFNFRVSLNHETTMDKDSSVIKGLLDTWGNNKKIFRYMNRVSFTHPDYPFMIDLSIVKESSRNRNSYLIPQYTIQDSNVFNNYQHYEIEIECINTLVGSGTLFNTPERLDKALKTVTKIILSGLQESSFPISYKEQEDIQKEYMDVIWGTSDKNTQTIEPKNFIGPSSYTLQLENIVEDETMYMQPNIRRNYCVTDKADGERKMLYIAGNKKIYFINTNMQIQFTGAITKNDELKNTLLDGEHIIYNKYKKYINLYAAFDIYYLNGKDIRAQMFTPSSLKKEKQKELFRLPTLLKIVNLIKPLSIVGESIPSPLRIKTKTFYSTNENEKTIFQGCQTIMQRINDGLFEYATDGLIFTPTNLSVGAKQVGDPLKNTKISWENSFKWKPATDNTIDFLVSVKKNMSGGEFIGNLFTSGIDTGSTTQLTEYKSLVLRVGYNEKRHGYINPCQDIIDDILPSLDSVNEKNNYVPKQFYPSNPSDLKAGLCNIKLKELNGGNKVMLTEENEVIEDNMIIEFKYVKENDELWNWVPLRVRYDKTNELRSGKPNYGNAYHVANSIWKTIHAPITEEMITTGLNIPNEIVDTDVYYNTSSVSNSDEKYTRSMRDFHNLFVKKKLITSVSQKGDTLIDLAVGKGGDFPKWINAALKFVFGIDISRDNIHNRLDGACVRYLNLKKKTKEMPSALFVHGNSSINIRNAKALFSDKDKQITKAIFGEGAKDAKELGKGVYKHYGIAKNGFDVCSIQFAVHYMFESNETFHNFLRNVSEVTKIGGYLIGTSYDGKEIFKLLKNKKPNESVTVMQDNYKLLEITKKYTQTKFPDNDTSIGYAIDVFQDTINKTFREYLVNYNYFTQMLELYGFVLLTKEETDKLGLSSSSESFNELFKLMQNELKTMQTSTQYGSPYKEASNMSAGERTISFLNRYFIYKKIRNVDADKISQRFIDARQSIESSQISAVSSNYQSGDSLPIKKNIKIKLVAKPIKPI